MRIPTRSLPRTIAVTCAALVAVGGAALTSAPDWTAAAADADCTAATLAHTVSGVADNLGKYLDAHPDVNTAFTNLKGEPRPQMRADAQAYLAANPAVKSDLQALRAPVTDLAQRCGLTMPAGPLGF